MNSHSLHYDGKLASTVYYLVMDGRGSFLPGRNLEGEMAVVFVRKAQALPGKEAEAIKFGTEIAKMVADIVGVEVIVGQQVGGPIGQVGWRATCADMAAFEKAMGKILANESYRQHIAKPPEPIRSPTTTSPVAMPTRRL